MRSELPRLHLAVKPRQFLDLVEEWVRAPGTALVGIGILVFVLANVRGGWWGFSVDQIELASVLVACDGWLVNIYARLRAQRQLHDQTSQLRLLVSQMPANVWTTDTELRLTSVFGTLISQRDNPAARVPGRTLYDIFETRDERHPVIAAHLSALRGESAPYERVAGDLVVEGRVELLRDDRGQIIGCVGAAMDVSAWRRAEIQVRRLAAAVESSGEAIITATTDGIIESWNAAAERLFGYSADEILGSSVSVLFPPERSHEMHRNLEMVARGGRVESYETERLRKGGAAIAVSVTLSPIRDAGGKVAGVSATVRDITERTRAEDALRRSEASYRSLVRSMPHGMYRSTVDGRFLTVNPAMVEMLGYASEAELLAVDVATDVYQDRVLRERLIEEHRNGGVWKPLEVGWKRKDGTPITVRLSGRTVRDERAQWGASR